MFDLIAYMEAVQTKEIYDLKEDIKDSQQRMRYSS